MEKTVIEKLNKNYYKVNCGKDYEGNTQGAETENRNWLEGTTLHHGYSNWDLCNNSVYKLFIPCLQQEKYRH